MPMYFQTTLINFALSRPEADCASFNTLYSTSSWLIKPVPLFADWLILDGYVLKWCCSAIFFSHLNLDKSLPKWEHCCRKCLWNGYNSYTCEMILSSVKRTFPSMLSINDPMCIVHNNDHSYCSQTNRCSWKRLLIIIDSVINLYTITLFCFFEESWIWSDIKL